jgi:hypothetical protein
MVSLFGPEDPPPPSRAGGGHDTQKVAGYVPIAGASVARKVLYIICLVCQRRERKAVRV